MVMLYPIIVLQQSMNDSFASAQDYQHKISNNLFNQIQTENTNHWKNDQFSFSFDRSQNEDMNGSRRSVSFDNDLAIQSKIIEPILQAQQILEMPQEQEQENKQVQLEPLEIKNQEPPSSLSSTSNQPCQVTIIIHQESLASKLYEEIDTQDSSSFSISLKSFLSLNDKNYKPHVKCLKFLYNSLKEYSKKSLQNLKNYIYFNEVKLKQEIESLRFLDSLQAASREEKDTENLNMDEKVILLQIRNQNISRREKRKVFYKAIQGYYQKLLQCWRKIKQRREKRERYIEQEIIRVIDRIQLEMEDMIICRLQNQKEHLQNFYISRKIRSPNPFLIKDKYLEMKYLMQRENAYLKLMHDFNGKVITYMVSMFSKEESQIAKTIKEVLIDYAISYMECYDSSNQILNMKIDNLEQSKCEEHVKIQLCENLLNMIPIQLYNIAERNQKIKYSPSEKLEALLTDFSNSLQNTIFLSTIEMNNDFIMFRNQALWKTNSSILHKEQSSILYESKAQSKFETKQVLTNSRHSNSQTHLQKNMKVIVVLTSNYHLHLQYEDKVATLRLGDIKLSKRGREVIITSKEKGLGGYLGLKKELGVLQFQSVSEVELFAQKLSRALSRIAYYS